MAGGDYSSVQLFETLHPATGSDCSTVPVGVIPISVAIGDAITNVVGRFTNFVASGTMQPANTAQEINVTSGSLTVGALVGEPMATTVSIADIMGVPGMTATNGTRSLALQGALVTVQNAVLDTAPTSANHYVMLAHAGTATTPQLNARVSIYSGVGCQRTALAALPAGTGALGSVTGVLQYSFGQWVVVVRRPSDISSVPGACADGGGADSGVDAGT
jgi:hypothetical protein